MPSRLARCAKATFSTDPGGGRPMRSRANRAAATTTTMTRPISAACFGARAAAFSGATCERPSLETPLFVLRRAGLSAEPSLAFRPPVFLSTTVTSFRRASSSGGGVARVRSCASDTSSAVRRACTSPSNGFTNADTASLSARTPAFAHWSTSARRISSAFA